MKYKVTGVNRETGARMTLEFEAESKAAAERKATRAGMSVHRVEDITDGHVAHALEPNPNRRRRAAGVPPIVKLIVLLAILACAYYFIWPSVRTMLRRNPNGRGRSEIIRQLPIECPAGLIVQHLSESDSSRSS